MVACLFASTASAQFVNSGNTNTSVGSKNSISSMSTENYSRFYVSYNLLKINWEDNQSEMEEAVPLTSSLTAGYLYASSLTNQVPLFLEYGANFQYSFGKEDDYSLNMYSVNIPINFAFKFQFKDVSLTPYVGVNCRVNVAGSAKPKKGDSINIFDKDDMGGSDNTPKRFQAGINFGIGFSYKAIYLGVGYISDFSKIYNNDDADMVGKIGTTTLTVGINF